MTQPPLFTYSRWRHGGWYVHGVLYPGGAIGCVSRNYADRQWRIVCDPRPFETRATFRSRAEAALAEWQLARTQHEERHVGTAVAKAQDADAPGSRRGKGEGEAGRRPGDGCPGPPETRSHGPAYA